METTIQIKKDLKERLNALRLYPNESYDSVIRRLSELAEDEEPLSKDTIEKIEMSLKDIKEGRVYTTDEVRKRLKIASTTRITSFSLSILMITLYFPVLKL